MFGCGEDMHAARFQNPGYLFGSDIWIKDVLENILRNEDVKGIAWKCQLFKVFASHTVYSFAVVGVREELAVGVRFAIA
jgi:hypothetical protein